MKHEIYQKEKCFPPVKCLAELHSPVSSDFVSGSINNVSKVLVEKNIIGEYINVVDKEYMIVEQSDIQPIFGSRSGYFVFVDTAEEGKDKTGYFLRTLDKSECKKELEKSKEEQLKLSNKIEILSKFLKEYRLGFDRQLNNKKQQNRGKI